MLGYCGGMPAPGILPLLLLLFVVAAASAVEAC
jgi:hypothetical protein